MLELIELILYTWTTGIAMHFYTRLENKGNGYNIGCWMITLFSQRFGEKTTLICKKSFIKHYWSISE